MKPSKDISNELREIAPTLAQLDKKQMYTVADSYFHESADHIVSLVSDAEAYAMEVTPMLNSLPKVKSYDVPVGYFAAFSEEIMTNIHAAEVAEELAYASPTLVGLERKELRSVPANYFAVFPMMIARLVAREAEAHRSAMDQQISRWSILVERISTLVSKPKYTFAMACMVAIIVVVGVGFTHSTLTPEEKIFAQMQQIPESELQMYMGKHRDDFDERVILHNINDIEFTHYFDKPENIPAHLKNGTQEVPENVSEDIID